MLPLAFTLGSGALAFVRTGLSLVCQLFSLVRELVPFVGDPISFICEPLASRNLGFPSRQIALALVKFGRPPISAARLIGAVLSHHHTALPHSAANAAQLPFLQSPAVP